MAVPAHFSNRWQNRVRKITSTKIRVKFYEPKTRNSIFWQFLRNYMLGNSWKLYAEKFLETTCWEILGNHMLENSGGCWLLYEGGNYGTMLWYHTTVSRQWHLELC